MKKLNSLEEAIRVGDIERKAIIAKEEAENLAREEKFKVLVKKYIEIYNKSPELIYNRIKDGTISDNVEIIYRIGVAKDPMEPSAETEAINTVFKNKKENIVATLREQGSDYKIYIRWNYK